MQTKSDVEKIIEYMQDKLESIRKKMEKYEGPIMAEVLKNNQHVATEYFRLCARADEIEDNLLAIQKFAGKKTKRSDGEEQEET